MHKLFFSLSMMIPLIFNACSMTYSDTVEYENFGLRYSNSGKDAYIYEYKYTDSFDIIIPEKYENYVVNRLGGYFGRGVPDWFCINLNVTEDIYDNMVTSSSFNEEDYENVEYYDFNLYITEYIKEIDAYSYIVALGENSTTAYVPRVNAIVDEDNKYFYSENGIIYEKKSNEKVTGFYYLSEWGN